MSNVYICSVSQEFPENYELGLRIGKWGVEDNHRRRIEDVRRGDLLIFVVAGAFRSIHRILSDPYRENTLIWPPRKGDLYPNRIDIGPAEISGNVRVATLAPRLKFIANPRAWAFSLRGANGVFNDRAAPEDVELISAALIAHSSSTSQTSATGPVALRKVVTVEPTYWLPGFLDRLAELVELERPAVPFDPFAGADVWRQGLLTGTYTDRRKIPAVAIAPMDRPPKETVLSTLYGLSALRQSSERLKEVRGFIFLHDGVDEVTSLVRGVPNVSAVPYEVHVSLRR